MYCPKCGAENQDDVSFCPKCGTKLKEENENESPQNELAAKFLRLSKRDAIKIDIICAAISFFILLISFTTFSNDLSSFWGYYNYKSPLSPHELMVLLGMWIGALGLLVNIGCIIFLYTYKKK